MRAAAADALIARRSSLMPNLREQLRNNAVALVSLVVALGSLAYNTWRNERTEHNRNIRTAGFELLTKLAELERVVFLAQYDRDTQGGNPRTGWTYVLVIRDLSELVPEDVPGQAANLRKVWAENWEGLGRDDEAAVDRIDNAITKLRETTLRMLRSLR
jgi:thymidylate synthase